MDHTRQRGLTMTETALDTLCVNAIRTLAMDAVPEKSP
jgi:hypothetical protein